MQPCNPCLPGPTNTNIPKKQLRARNADHWFLTTSDRGSNEVMARKYFASLVMNCDNVFFLEADCLEHQAHLICLAGLSFVDQLLSKSKPWKYYTSLAIATNVFRAQAKEVHLQWCMLFGPVDANQKVKKLFPRCQSGRWGSIHTTEERFIQAGFDHVAMLVATMANAWGGKTKQKRSANKENVPPADTVNLNPDTLALEQATEFSKRMGKWRSYALQTSQDLLWGRLVEVMHWSRGPLMHFTHFLKAKISDVELHSQGSHMCQLVNGKADSILAEFSLLLTASSGPNDDSATGSLTELFAVVFLRT